MKKYLAIFRIRFINSLQYRIAALAGLATNCAWGVMLILGFAAFYRTAPEAFPMTFSQTASYIWLQQMIFVMVAIWLNDSEIIEAVRDGAIAYELVRPMDIYNRWFFQLTAKRLAGLILRGGPTLLVAFLLPYPYNLSLPPDGIQFFWFLLSIVLSLCVIIIFTLFMYISLFYTMSFRGTQLMVAGLTLFLAGGIIPIPFFPEPFQNIAQLLPFAAMQDTPLRIYSGHIVNTAIFQVIGIQIFWIVILLIAGRITIKHALKRVIVQGG